MSNIVLGTNKQGTPIALPIDKFTKHAVVVGATGSGKSGCIINIAEQFIDNEVPIIMVDIKGDMCNIALQDKSFRKSMNLRVLTPGGSHGESIDLFCNLQKPERVQSSVTQILKMTGEKNVNPLSSNKHALLSHLLNHYHTKNVKADITTLIDGLNDPPFLTFGALPLEEAIPARTRAALAAKLNTLIVAPSFKQWHTGSDLDVDELLHNSVKGKSNVTVYQVSHLGEEERMFALALLFDSLVYWMRQQRGTEELKAALFVDECAGLIPPHPKNPATKPSLLCMLKQARAYGLGLILSSQNPMDLDYKAMGNCETWLVGRLLMANDRKRIIEAIGTVGQYDRERLELRIGRLTPRDFVLCRPKSTADFVSKDVRANLVGPMTPHEVTCLLDQPLDLDDLDLEVLTGGL